MAPRFTHLDSAESVYFARQLEYIYSRSYDIKYPDLKFRVYIPQSEEADPGAQTVTYEQFDEVGAARIGSSKSDKPPRVDIVGAEFTRPVRPVEASYGWTVQDIKSAAMAKRNLSQKRGRACRRAIELKLDEVAAIGAPLVGIPTGALNDAGVDINASGGSWVTPAAADTIILEVATMWSDIVDDTNEVETANTLVLPGREWAHIATTPRSTTSDTTILDFIRKSFPDLTSISSWYRLATAGVGAVRRGWMYQRRDDILANEIPNDYEQLPVQPDGLQYVVYAFASTAGAVYYYPLAAHYLDGI